jgi:ElaB/YqjD/DUF883 family membrane-anchored ribosome-binding protein
MVTVRKRNGSGGHNVHAIHGVHARMKSLRGDLDALQKDVGRLVSDVGEAAGEQVQEAMNGVVHSAREAADRVESWGSDKMPRVRKLVRSQPFAACAVALSAGALLGALLLRR